MRQKKISIVKMIAWLIVGKELVIIKNSFGNKASLYFGPIVPIFSCNQMYEIRNDSLLTNINELVYLDR